MPQANSTTSRPRATSPSASAVTLPCWAVRIAASSSRWAWTSSRKANSTCVRRLSEAWRHSAAAAAAEATAASTSAVEASRTWRPPRRWRGRRRERCASPAPSQTLPSTQWAITGVCSWVMTRPPRRRDLRRRRPARRPGCPIPRPPRRSVSDSGGAMRRQLPNRPPLPTSSPRCRHSSSTRAAAAGVGRAAVGPDQLDADHQAPAPHLADDAELAGQRRARASRMRAPWARALACRSWSSR